MRLETLPSWRAVSSIDQSNIRPPQADRVIPLHQVFRRRPQITIAPFLYVGVPVGLKFSRCTQWTAHGQEMKGAVKRFKLDHAAASKEDWSALHLMMPA